MIEILPTFHIDPTAEKFARECSLEAVLEQLGALTAEVIPDADRIEAELHNDPDIDGVSWITLRVQVDWPDAERVRQARNAWYERTGREFSREVLGNFGLEIDRRPA